MSVGGVVYVFVLFNVWNSMNDEEEKLLVLNVHSEKWVIMIINDK